MKKSGKGASLHAGLKRKNPSGTPSGAKVGKGKVNNNATRGGKAAATPRTLGPRTA